MGTLQSRCSRSCGGLGGAGGGGTDTLDPTTAMLSPEQAHLYDQIMRAVSTHGRLEGGGGGEGGGIGGGGGAKRLGIIKHREHAVNGAIRVLVEYDATGKDGMGAGMGKEGKDGTGDGTGKEEEEEETHLATYRAKAVFKRCKEHKAMRQVLNVQVATLLGLQGVGGGGCGGGGGGGDGTQRHVVAPCVYSGEVRISGRRQLGLVEQCVHLVPPDMCVNNTGRVGSSTRSGVGAGVGSGDGDALSEHHTLFTGSEEGRMVKRIVDKLGNKHVINTGRTCCLY